MKKSVVTLWKVFLYSFGFFVLLTIGFYFGIIGDMPTLSELENPSASLSSEVIATDGSVLGRYFVQDRSNSEYKDISPYVFNALLATEDERFFDHSGIDGRALLRVAIFLGKKGGGSTITQQLAKNLFPRQKSNIFTMPFVKLREWVLAVKLERNLTKNEILTLYLNTVPFGDNVYGIKNASLTFFSKTPDKLSLDEAAVLIGMLKGNTLYNPRRNPAKAFDRRNVVLNQMVKYKFIKQEEADKLSQFPIKLNYHKIDYHKGSAPYFRQILEQELKSICKELKKSDGSSYNLYRDGLKIYTTIDLRMQLYAEQAVEQHLTNLQKSFFAQANYKDGGIWKNHQDALDKAMKQSDRYQALKDADKEEDEISKIFNTKIKMTVFAWNKNHSIDTVMSPMDSIKYTKMFLQAGFMAMDPFTGEVKAWVGGINHDYFQYDHVNKNTKRQVGSTIKPLLYCLAVDKGFSPCGTLSTGAQQFSGAKTAYNAGGSKTGSLPMSTALALSINNAALFLLNQVGIEPFVDFAKKCGIESDMDPYPSVALGVSAISLYEMLQAYTMFPAGGVNTEPFFISRIEDKNGNLLKTFAPKQKEIINPQTAFKMVRMMQGVVDRGTAQRIRRYGLYGDIAGKTGTTNKQADAWFIGYTPQLLAGTWVGCDDRFLRFNSEAQGQGSAAALPIWINFFHKVFNDRSLEIKQDVRFKAPVPFSDCSGYNANTIADPNDTTSVQTVPIDQTSGDIIEEVTPEEETQP